MNPGVIAAAAVGASRGIVECELRTWPLAATAASVGLSLAVHVLAERPQVLVASAAALALIAILIAQQQRA